MTPLDFSAVQTHLHRHRISSTQAVARGRGVCAAVFKNLKVDIEKTRQEIVRELDPNGL